MERHGSPAAVGEGGGVAREAERRRLRAVLGLTSVYMVAEAVGGWWTGSLALLADAGHMLTDVGSLGLALGASWMARRPATTRHTYAYGRVEILAALLNGIALWGIVVWIVVEAVGRLRSPTPVEAGPMMAIAAGGLAVNVAAFAILHRGAAQGHSLNLRAATLHVLGDLLGSVGALAAGGIVLLTGWTGADPAASLLISALIVASSWRVVRDAIHILLEGAPRGLDVESVLRRIGELDGVAGVHDLHVWTITSGYPALSAHVVCEHAVQRDILLARVNRLLRDEFGIDHTTIQLEGGVPPGHERPMARPLETVD